MLNSIRLFKHYNFWNFTKVVVGLGICLILIGCGDPERDQRARTSLKKVAFWFIADGIAEYYQGKSIKLLDSKIEEFGVYSTRNPGIIIDGKDGKIADITAASFGWGTYVRCYARLESEGIYEYWVIKFSNRHKMPRKIIFLTTKAGALDQPREIIHRSNNFFPSYEISKDVSINFPMDDGTIYDLMPWLHPKEFMETELEDVYIAYENNKPVRKNYSEAKKHIKEPTFWEELWYRMKPIT